MPHTLFENALFTTVVGGTFINTNYGGTTTTVAAGAYEYHWAGFLGTMANNGTINVYGCQNSGGSTPTVLSTLNVGSANGAGAGIEIKSTTLASLGTLNTHLAMAGTVESGGTWRGAFVIISHQPRSAPTSNGLAANGTSLA